MLANSTLFMAMTVYFAVKKNEALLSQLPASSPMCRLGLFPLLATTAKGVALPNRLTHTASSINVHSQQITPQQITFRSRKTSFEEEESCDEESDLMAAFEREMDELASVVEELEDTLDVEDVEDLRDRSESMYEGLATI